MPGSPVEVVVSPRLRWLVVLGVASGIVALAPFLGELRTVLAARSGDRFLDALALGLALVAGGIGVWTLVAIRRRRLVRYGALALAVALVALQAVAWATENREVDLVERVHLLEYGLLAALFAWAFFPRHRNRALPVLALAATALTAVADETVQWASSARVGDGRDLVLNLWAGVVGLVVAYALAAPEGWWRPVPPRSRRAAAWLGAAVVLGSAGLVQVAHLGHWVEGPPGVRFRSWYPQADLAAVGGERAERWAREPPPRPAPLVREDAFHTEAGWHATARNDAVARDDLATAVAENRILERWYEPYLALGPGNRWPPEQRTDLVSRLEKDPEAVAALGRYVSPVLSHRLIAGADALLFWLGVAALAVALTAMGWPSGRDGSRAAGGAGREPESV